MSTYAAGLCADIGIGLLGGLSVYVILATGQLSLGNAAFMAVGAYLASILTVEARLPVTAALALAGVASGVLGVLIGFPALRLRGIYLAMATLGFGEMTRSFFLDFAPTGGAEGFHGMRPISAAYIWAWAAGFLVLLILLERSRLWLEFRAVNDDERASDLIGINTTAIKVAAFGFGAAIAGIAGGLFAHYHLYIEPGMFGFDRSIEMVLYVILGGSTLAVGPLLGAGLIVLLPEFLRFLVDWRLAAYGALLIVVLLFRRQGLVGRGMFRALARRAWAVP